MRDHPRSCWFTFPGDDILDETGDAMKGDKTPGVHRQWCGAVGETENCIVTVHLAYARNGLHAPLDRELYAENLIR